MKGSKAKGRVHPQPQYLNNLREPNSLNSRSKRSYKEYLRSFTLTLSGVIERVERLAIRRTKRMSSLT